MFSNSTSRIIIMIKMFAVFFNVFHHTIYFSFSFRKAVKAAIVLLPLLGVNNFLNMVEPPMDSVIKFGLWSYTSHFLTSFQGFFISLLYCFLNGEVRRSIYSLLQSQQYFNILDLIRSIKLIIFPNSAVILFFYIVLKIRLNVCILFQT